MRISGARAGDNAFRSLQIPDQFQAGTAPGDVPALYQRQSVADRLFIDAILADRPITPNFLDGLKAQAIIAAAITAHQTRTWVSLG